MAQIEGDHSMSDRMLWTNTSFDLCKIAKHRTYRFSGTDWSAASTDLSRDTSIPPEFRRRQGRPESRRLADFRYQSGQLPRSRFLAKFSLADRF